MNHDQKLFDKLCRELFQTETSAITHSRAEARRLGDCAPAAALRAVADHADAMMARLPERLRQPQWSAGMLAGRGLMLARYLVIDALVDRERVYRGTLLGMHHGVDLVTSLVPLAYKLGDAALAEWCEEWLKTRRPLVESAVAQLQWFSEHAEQALQNGRTPMTA